MEGRLGSLVRRLRQAGGGAVAARREPKLDEILRRLDQALPPGPAATAPTAPASAPSAPAAQVIQLDYPVRPRPRFGFGRPSHPELAALLDGHRDRYAVHLRRASALSDELARIPVEASADPTEPFWRNPSLPGLDAAALYSLLVHEDPVTYLEVGSGTSTTFARRAIADHGLRTRIVSIDAHPRAEIDAICDEVVRSPLEEADLAVFDTVGPGDVVFVDNFHRASANSDATVVFLEVLPRLAAGVLVEIHDIYLPDDYPPEWNDRFYNEQYVLAGFLLGGEQGFTTELPNWFVSTDAELSAILAPLWAGLGDFEHHGGSFWLRMT